MLREFIKENGCYDTLVKIGVDPELILEGLTEEEEKVYAGYEWVHGERIVHAIPPKELLESGRPWEEWYKDADGNLFHHVLFLEKTERCDETWDGRDLPADDDHPESVKGYFWYLYNDESPCLLR